MDLYMETNEPAAVVRSVLGPWVSSVSVQAVLDDAQRSLDKTIDNRAAEDRVFDFPGDTKAVGYCLRTVKRKALRGIKGARRVSTHERSRDPFTFGRLGGPQPPDETGIDVADAHGLLDRVAARFEPWVIAAEKCEGCDRKHVLSGGLALIESARDAIDRTWADDRYDRTNADEVAQSVYRGFGQALGEDYVLDAEGRVTDKARQLQKRCRPCIRDAFAQVFRTLLPGSDPT